MSTQGRTDQLPTAAGPVFRRAGVSDAGALAAFAARSFRETFAHSTTAAHMEAHVAAAYGIEQQSVELANPGAIALLHERDGAIVAFAQVRTKAPPDVVRERGAAELQRFYVDAPWHGRGLAQPMMAQCFAAARVLGAAALWLSVWEHNARAIAFYDKCGFAGVGLADFWLGSDRQVDRIMVCRLDVGA